MHSAPIRETHTDSDSEFGAPQSINQTILLRTSKFININKPFAEIAQCHIRNHKRTAQKPPFAHVTLFTLSPIRFKCVDHSHTLETNSNSELPVTPSQSVSQQLRPNSRKRQSSNPIQVCSLCGVFLCGIVDAHELQFNSIRD